VHVSPCERVCYQHLAPQTADPNRPRAI
jgi:hypothetical protein